MGNISLQQAKRVNSTFNPVKFKEEVESVGFQDVEVATATHEFNYESGEKFLHIFLSNPPFLRAASSVDGGIREGRRIVLSLAAAAGGSVEEITSDYEFSTAFKQPLRFPATANILIAKKP